MPMPSSRYTELPSASLTRFSFFMPKYWDISTPVPVANPLQSAKYKKFSDDVIPTAASAFVPT